MLQIQSTEFVVVLQVDHVQLPNTVGLGPHTVYFIRLTAMGAYQILGPRE